VIGVIPDIDIDHAGVSCEPGDRLMLCSDGLFKALSLDELKVVLTTEVEPQRSPDRLATSAVEHEAEGNVTAMIIDVRAD
jgi:protein phosphatase